MIELAICSISIPCSSFSRLSSYLACFSNLVDRSFRFVPCSRVTRRAHHSALSHAPIPPAFTCLRWFTQRAVLPRERRSPPSLHHCTCCLRQARMDMLTAPGNSDQPRSVPAQLSLYGRGPSSVRTPSTSASGQRKGSEKPELASPQPTTSRACCNLRGRSSAPGRPRRRVPAPCPLARVALGPAQPQ